MTNAEYKRLQAQRHNAKLDWPKVEPLFAWFEALSGKRQAVVSPRKTGKIRGRSMGLLMAAAMMSNPTIFLHAGHEEIARHGRSRRSRHD